jgi:hypothetical protein
MSDFGVIESTIAPLRPADIDSDEVTLTIINKSLRAKAILHRRGLKSADTGFLAFLMIIRIKRVMTAEWTKRSPFRPSTL